jgi:Sec-independent protein translocase protein TatA
MLSPSDTIIIFAAALLLFGPEHLPRIAKQLGEAMRHVQNTTHTFMQEMDRAAAAAEVKTAPPVVPEQLPDTGMSEREDETLPETSPPEIESPPGKNGNVAPGL